MNKCNQIYGVDISKNVFDVVDSKGNHSQFKNDSNGFKAFQKTLPADALVVMEATGYYQYRLAQFLYEQGLKVSVVNPLSVKRFIQMKLSKVKTDKSDAKAICEYATINEVPLYTAKDKNQAECLQLLRIINIYLNQSTALKKKLQERKPWGNHLKQYILL